MRALAFLAAVIVLLLPATASARTVTAGISETRVELGGLTVGDLGVADLGSARALATTADQAPAALARAVLPGGERVEVTSADPEDVPAQAVEVPGVGTVRAAGLVAEADDERAAATVEALRAELAPLGVGLGSQDGALGARVDQVATTATNGVALSDLSVTLADVLGTELLARLPLGVLLELSDTLGLDLGGIGNGQLDDVLAQLDAGRTLADQVDAARQAAAQARDAVAVAREDLAAARRQLADAREAALPCEGVPVVTDVCADLNQAVEEAAQAVDAAQQAVDDALAQVQPAEDALDDLADQADALLARLSEVLDGVDALDLEALLSELRDGIAGVELLAVDSLALTVASTATASKSQAKVGCAVDGVRVAAQPADVGACAELEEVLDAAAADILGVLRALPLTSPQLDGPGDLVRITAPALSVTEPDAVRDGARIAEARVTGLGLDIAALELDNIAVADLLTPVTTFIDDALPELAALPGVDTTAVSAALDGLLAQVQGLPTGDLAGLSTPPVPLAPARAVAASQFGIAAVAVAPDAPTGAVGTPGTGPTGQTLPETGGGIGAGILLLGTGLGAAAWLRRGRRA